MISVDAECRRIIYLSISFMLIINFSHCIRENIILPKIPHHLINKFHLQDYENYEPPQNEPIYSLYTTIIKKDGFSNQAKHDHLVFYEYLEYILKYINDINFFNFINENNIDSAADYLLYIISNDYYLRPFGILSHDEYINSFKDYSLVFDSLQHTSYRNQLNLLPNEEEDCIKYVKRIINLDITSCKGHDEWFASLKKSIPLPIDFYRAYYIRNIKLNCLPVAFNDIHIVYQIEEKDNFKLEFKRKVPYTPLVVKTMQLILNLEGDDNIIHQRKYENILKQLFN